MALICCCFPREYIYLGWTVFGLSATRSRLVDGSKIENRSPCLFQLRGETGKCVVEDNNCFEFGSRNKVVSSLFRSFLLSKDQRFPPSVSLQLHGYNAKTTPYDGEDLHCLHGQWSVEAATDRQWFVVIWGGVRVVYIFEHLAVYFLHKTNTSGIWTGSLAIRFSFSESQRFISG